MISIDGTTIYMTRGDTLRAALTITKPNGEVYETSANDIITFTCKKTYASEEILIQKIISPVSMMLELLPEDTKEFNMPSSYVYDIQLQKEDGTIDTFIAKAALKITEEVG